MICEVTQSSTGLYGTHCITVLSHWAASLNDHQGSTPSPGVCFWHCFNFQSISSPISTNYYYRNHYPRNLFTFRFCWTGSEAVLPPVPEPGEGHCAIDPIVKSAFTTGPKEQRATLVLHRQQKKTFHRWIIIHSFLSGGKITRRGGLMWCFCAEKEKKNGLMSPVG